MSTWADQIEAARGQHSDVATFDAACSWVQDVAAPQRLLPDACLLRLYAAFKQATVGPAPPRSGQLDPKKRAKWQAWDAVRSLNIREARHLYCTLVTQFSAAAAAATPTRGGQPPTPTPKPTSAPAAATELPVTSRVLSFGPSRSGAVVYRVESRWAGGGSVSTHRRFSDFRTLHTALRSSLSLGEFPCARAPFKTSALAARRVGELSAYISSLLSTACDALAAADGAGAAGGGAHLTAVVLVDFLGGRPEPRTQTPTPSKPTVNSAAAAAAASSGGDEPAAVAPKPLGGSALKCGGGMLASLAVCIGPA